MLASFWSIMALALILIFVLILFLVALITSALSAPGERSYKNVSAREFPSPPHKRGIASQRPTSAAIEKATPYHQTHPELADVQVNHFTAAGRTTFAATDETATGFEEVFASVNKPFTGRGRNDGDDGFCFLTGQRQATCQCSESINRRARRDR